eukprot:scaffold144849_cov37-Attheya_sp.AAC.1
MRKLRAVQKQLYECPSSYSRDETDVSVQYRQRDTRRTSVHLSLTLREKDSRGTKYGVEAGRAARTRSCQSGVTFVRGDVPHAANYLRKLLSLLFLVDRDDAAVDATSVITVGLLLTLNFLFFVHTFPYLTMSALDDLISSSEGLSLAPAEAVALTPA